AIKTVVFKVVPDDATRLAALKRGEVDVAYGLSGALAEEVKRTPGLSLKAAKIPVTNWLVFADQADAKSPWHDRRVRLAANLAINREAINTAGYLGLGRISSRLIPQSLGYYSAPPLYPFHPKHAVARAPRGGGLSKRFRGGRSQQRALRGHGHRRARGQRPQRGGHPGQAAPARAGGLPQAVRGPDAQERDPGGKRSAWQCRHPHR